MPYIVALHVMEIQNFSIKFEGPVTESERFSSTYITSTTELWASWVQRRVAEAAAIKCVYHRHLHMKAIKVIYHNYFIIAEANCMRTRHRYLLTFPIIQLQQAARTTEIYMQMMHCFPLFFHR